MVRAFEMFNDVFSLVFFTVSLICPLFSTALESPDPEILLQPRNFNPHPYEEGGRPLRPYRLLQAKPNDRNGPVLFPPNPEDVSASASRNTLPAHPVDEHPYANVARKHRIQLGGRYVTGDQDNNNINRHVYNGLSNYAAKVLKKAVVKQDNGYSDPSLAEQKKNYAFSYSVRDQSTGDDFSHTQSQNAKTTNGEYRVKLPDGRVQIVSYIADKNGYKADVKYTNEDYIQPNDYKDYYDDRVTQIEVPVYDDVSQQYFELAPVQRLVHILPRSHHLQSSDKYVGSTSVPYTDNNILNGYDGHSILVSTVAPEHYTPLYVSTPKYDIISNANLFHPQ